MAKAFESAVRLLSRREHGAQELYEKLKYKGFNPEEIKEALNECQRLDLQNDTRFAASFSALRIRQGYGPLKIIQELSNRGINKELIHKVLEAEEDNWLACALNVWQKKNKGQTNFSFNELQKQQRFLQYRGFDSDTIARVRKEISN